MRARTVLLAEDDCDDVFMLKTAFRKADLPYVVYFTENGEEAIRWLRGDGIFADRSRFPFPDLLITDLKMPRLSGFDLLRWIEQQRDQPCYSNLPVVVLSSSDEPSDIAKARALGITAYIRKDAGFQAVIDFLGKFSEEGPDARFAIR